MKKHILLAVLTLVALLFMFGCGAAPEAETSTPAETEIDISDVDVDVPEIYFPKYDDGLAVVYFNDNGGTSMLFLPAIGRTYNETNTMSFIKPLKNLESPAEGEYKLPEDFADLGAEGVVTWQEIAYAVVRDDAGAQQLIELGKDGAEKLDWNEFYKKAYVSVQKNGE